MKLMLLSQMLWMPQKQADHRHPGVREMPTDELVALVIGLKPLVGPEKKTNFSEHMTKPTTWPDGPNKSYEQPM